LKEEALDHTMWRAQFGRGFGPVVRQTTKLNEYVVFVGRYVRLFSWFVRWVVVLCWVVVVWWVIP